MSFSTVYAGYCCCCYAVPPHTKLPHTKKKRTARTQDLDMFNLFGSPAGRALNNTTATTTNGVSPTATPHNNHVSFHPPPATYHLHQQHPNHNQLVSSPPSPPTADQLLYKNINCRNSAANISVLDKNLTNSSTTIANLIDGGSQTATLVNSNNHLASGNGVEAIGQNHLVYNNLRKQHGDGGESRTKRKTNLFTKKIKFWKFLENEKNQRNSVDSGNSSQNGSPQSTSSNRWWRSQRKSSSEIYREAAQLLGLSCTLSDNCRCLDCQVIIVCTFILITFTIYYYHSKEQTPLTPSPTPANNNKRRFD